MQLMKPQLASGSYQGLVSAVIGLCSTSPAARTAGGSNTSQKSWLQFANLSPGGCGFLQIDIMSDKSLELSVINAADTTGKLMTNTAGTGITGAATHDDSKHVALRGQRGFAHELHRGAVHPAAALLHLVVGDRDDLDPAPFERLAGTRIAVAHQHPSRSQRE